MNTESQRPSRSIEGVHCTILGLSTFLVGLYFGQSLPPGVELVVLQTGLIGILGFLGLTQIRVTRREVSREAESRTRTSTSRQVERRLERHVSARHIHRIDHRIDRGTQRRRPLSAKKYDREANSVAASTD